MLPVHKLNWGVAASGLIAFVLTGCASFTSDGGLDAVSTMVNDRTGQAVHFSNAPVANEDRARIRELLATPLTVEVAMQIALTNNEGLKASFNELGISEADLVQAGRMRNPSISFGRISGGGDTEIDRSILFDLVGLLTLPIRAGIEQRRFDQAKIQAALRGIQLAIDTRRAYFNAVAAQQTAQFMEQACSVAQVSADLGSTMTRVGNWSKLDLAVGAD